MNKKNIIIITFVFLFFSIFFFGKCANVLIDFSRESYIPFQMLNHQKPYQDIFLIYGIFGYFINSLLYKISVNVNLIILEAHIISYFITILFYFIIYKFSTPIKSLLWTIFFITISVFSNSTFSFTMPYSYSTLWAVSGLYLAFFSVIYNKKDILFLSLGFILINRIEFFIPAFIFSVGYYIYKKEKFLINSLFVFFFPALELIYIIFNKITIKSILSNLSLIHSMMMTSSIKNLYSAMGGFFEIEFFKYNLINFLIFLFILLLSYLIYRFNKITAYLFLFVSFLFIPLFECFNAGFLIALILTLFAIYKKKLEEKDLILLFFAIILSSKALFSINPFSNSNFGYCFLIFYIFKISSYFINKNYLVGLLCCFLIVMNIHNAIYFYTNSKFKVKTDAGSIYFNYDDSVLFSRVNEYIRKNVGKNESMIVVPEGQLFNLINKKPWNFYNSTFTPLDFETFKEAELIKKLKENKTDYIIFYPRNTLDYGKKTICYDYGVDFCSFIADNYERKAIIEQHSKALIFKLIK